MHFKVFKQNASISSIHYTIGYECKQNASDITICILNPESLCIKCSWNISEKQIEHKYS